jgi:hypothetical protein
MSSVIGRWRYEYSAKEEVAERNGNVYNKYLCLVGTPRAGLQRKGPANGKIRREVVPLLLNRSQVMVEADA